MRIIECGVGEIDAEKAHIWWSVDDRKVKVVPFTLGQSTPLQQQNYNCDVGASLADWKEKTDDQRVLEMTEMAIEFMVLGYDATMVVREFAKVRQFLERGCESYEMARAIATALTGKETHIHPDDFKDRFVDR